MNKCKDCIDFTPLFNNKNRDGICRNYDRPVNENDQNDCFLPNYQKLWETLKTEIVGKFDNRTVLTILKIMSKVEKGEEK